MPYIAYSSAGQTAFQRLLGHNEDILESWNRLGRQFEDPGKLSGELKEQVRRTLAFGNGCEYCKAKGKPDERQEGERQSLAVAFADMFVRHRATINKMTFDVLKQTFTDKEIAELCAYICFTTASQSFGALMNLQPEDLLLQFDPA